MYSEYRWECVLDLGLTVSFQGLKIAVYTGQTLLSLLHTPRAQPHYRLKGNKGGVNMWGANPSTVW